MGVMRINMHAGKSCVNAQWKFSEIVHVCSMICVIFERARMLLRMLHGIG